MHSLSSAFYIFGQASSFLNVVYLLTMSMCMFNSQRVDDGLCDI